MNVCCTQEEDLAEAERSVDVGALKAAVEHLQKQKSELDAKYRQLE